jgi:hypothetical protein
MQYNIIMVVLTFLSKPASDQALAHLPIPQANKTAIPWQRAWQDAVRNIFASLPVQTRPLGFDIFNLSAVNLIAVQGGHPFTLGTDTIVLPASYFQHREGIKRTIMAHELVHLHQRSAPRLYERAYARLGFHKAHVNFQPALKKLLMYNPDGEAYEWVWIHQGHGYIPLGLNHKAYVALMGPVGRSTEGKDIPILPVNQVPVYYDHFQTHKQLYHPNEIIAHQITDSLTF